MNYIEKNMELGAWILEHKEDWMAICGRGREEMDVEGFCRLHNLLRESPYPELQMVLLTCNYSVVSEEIESNVIPVLRELLEERGLR